MIEYTEEQEKPTSYGAGFIVFMDLSDLYAVVVRTESFEGRSVEFFLVIRMSDADEQFRTLLH